LTELRRPSLLDPARHDRSQFASGDDALDEWLRHYAGQNRRRDTAATWVVTDAEDAVVGYATIAMSAIDRSSAPASVARQAPDPVPALLLGRLAVDRRRSGLGVGSALVAHVLATAVELNAKAACRAVVVNALHTSARSWWEHLGFSPFDPSNEQPLDLYLLTADIHATLQRMS
jgi:GNAT superfamily N-acetyltransferase